VREVDRCDTHEYRSFDYEWPEAQAADRRLRASVRDEWQVVVVA